MREFQTHLHQPCPTAKAQTSSTEQEASGILLPLSPNGFWSLKTYWEYSDRPGNRFPTLSWNSEHLAVWLGKSSVASGRQSNGCDVDVETWQVKLPLLGYHYYTE
jgi:hypothetical protein